jgi:hypothetical protein
VLIPSFLTPSLALAVDGKNAAYFEKKPFAGQTLRISYAGFRIWNTARGQGDESGPPWTRRSSLGRLRYHPCSRESATTI